MSPSPYTKKSSSSTSSPLQRPVISPHIVKHTSGDIRRPPIISTTSTISVTPSNSGKPALSLRPVETPRLVLTEDGSNSPISFLSSPGPQDQETRSMPSELSPRDRASSVVSASSHGSDGHQSRRESIAQRVAEKINSPTLKADHKKEWSRKSNRSRRASSSSAFSQQPGIASALAKSGLQIAGAPHGDDLVSKSSHGRAVSAGRSPYLVRAQVDDEESDDGYTEDEESDNGSDSEVFNHLPVTGFAVASNRRNAEFHAMFPTVDEGDYLIEDYGCALAKDILVHGRLYVSENHICFHSNLFGWVTDVVIPFSDVKTIEKKMTALVIPNAIGVRTNKDRHTFASLISRDSTFDVLMNIWRLAHPDTVMAAPSVTNGNSRPPSIEESDAPPAIGHQATECACGKAGDHYLETALETTFPSSPEKVYNLMFNSGWYRTFLSDNQKLKDIESSDWRPDEEKKLSRSTSYIKNLGGAIGPKQTKCHIVDFHDHCDFDDYICMITTTKTPDVPSGGVFSVKTRTCIMWAGSNSSRVIVTTQVDWTGKSWVKGIIEKSAIEGQRQYHDDLATGMRAHMKEHHSEFVPPGVKDDNEDISQGEVSAVPAPTEAQEYAAQNRRARQDADYWQLQGAFESVLSGVKSIASGVATAIKTFSDLLSDVPITKQSYMIFVIFFLLALNVYSYFVRPASQHNFKRLKRFGPSDDDVAAAVRMVLAGRTAITPREELEDLSRLLDKVDERSSALRLSLAGFDDLD